MTTSSVSNSANEKVLVLPFGTFAAPAGTRIREETSNGVDSYAIIGPDGTVLSRAQSKTLEKPPLYIHYLTAGGFRKLEAV